MGTPTRERQQIWKEKQAAGGKKSINVMVSAEVKGMIDKEKASTGKTIAEIIERSVREHLVNSPSNRRRINIDPSQLTEMQKNVLRSVRRKDSNPDYKNAWIPNSLNRMNYETLSGVEKWDNEEVQAALDYMDEHNLRWSLG